MLPLIIKMFPNLQILHLSDSHLFSSFAGDTLRRLVFTTGDRRGLKCLRLRGNHLGGFKVVSSSFYHRTSTNHIIVSDSYGYWVRCDIDDPDPQNVSKSLL